MRSGMRQREIVCVCPVGRIVTLNFVVDDGIPVGDDGGSGQGKKVHAARALSLNDNRVNIFAGPCDLQYSPPYCLSHTAIDKINPRDREKERKREGCECSRG